ncbi:N-acetylmuramoyl-L-alanine amidase [Rhodobacteraceae bacterium RKSG542]|uniref:peptidoglycan recognition protein family protein n=1 Tax=Pseudovibrio flavus TaxID=2529854 RepID=UPI0012BD486F|nr:N-acetylmuramoyl-L-alanine amidase [Pseudovibrio flavus]MTI19131.1 N-acetylmuramoyl-L-alanine amidase [Pseudovibrio flavus]
MSKKVECGVPARLHPSSNHNERGDLPIDMLLLHYTGMESEEAAVSRLCDPRAEVSAHYLVKEDGEILQMVPESRRAWHAGKSYWKGDRDINACSIGIEIVNGGHDFGRPAYPQVQIDAVIALCKDIIARHNIPAYRVLAHSDVAPSRKKDPGELFPWLELARAGVGNAIEPVEANNSVVFQLGDEGAPVDAIQSLLGLFGYEVMPTGVFDHATKRAVTAFQRHYRPQVVDGAADAQTVATLHTLLKSLPSL